MAAAPTVTGISPAIGTTATSVTITGTGFTGATSVSFGTVAVPASGFTVTSDTLISAQAPAPTGSGPVDVTVQTPGGTSATTPPADQFTYSTDPIAIAIQLLSVLVTPNPAATGSGQTPNLWTDGSNKAGTTSLFTTIQGFISAILPAQISNQINSALMTASKSVAAIATALGNVATSGNSKLSDISAAMTALQNALSLAQSLAPAGAAVVLTTGSTLFQNIESQLTALESTAGDTTQAITDAANDLAQLSQLLAGLAALFP